MRKYKTNSHKGIFFNIMHLILQLSPILLNKNIYNDE